MCYSTYSIQRKMLQRHVWKLYFKMWNTIDFTNYWNNMIRWMNTKIIYAILHIWRDLWSVANWESTNKVDLSSPFPYTYLDKTSLFKPPFLPSMLGVNHTMNFMPPRALVWSNDNGHSVLSLSLRILSAIKSKICVSYIA